MTVSGENKNVKRQYTIGGSTAGACGGNYVAYLVYLELISLLSSQLLLSQIARLREGAPPAPVVVVEGGKKKKGKKEKKLPDPNKPK